MLMRTTESDWRFEEATLVTQSKAETREGEGVHPQPEMQGSYGPTAVGLPPVALLVSSPGSPLLSAFSTTPSPLASNLSSLPWSH